MSTGPGHEYVILLTQRCNFRCAYCYQSRAPTDLSPRVLRRLAHIIQDERRPGTRVVFHGGEPLLRKDLVRLGVSLLLDEDGRRVCDFGIVTNGSLIDDETIALFRRHRFRVDVSFDGCREAQALRDPRSFDGIVATLRQLVPSHAAGELELAVGITVTLDNLPYLSRSVAFLTELGVPRIDVEGDLFGAWIEGAEQEVDRQVEEVVQLMEERFARGRAIPVSRVQPQPYDPAGRWWETDEERRRRREGRLAVGECRCPAAKASVVHPDGTVWACPLFVPGLGGVAMDRLAAPSAFLLGSWTSAQPPSPERMQSNGERIRGEPLMGPKGLRYSIFAECSGCPYVTDCSVCPAASHLPDAAKPAEEVPPLLCRLNMAFLSRRDRIRRPPGFMDALLSVASGHGD